MFKLQVSESIDFGFAMYRLVNKVKYNKAESEKEIDCIEAISEIIDELEEKIPLSVYRQMGQVVNKYFFNNFLELYACGYPEMSEEEVIQYIKELDASAFYLDYLKYTLNVTEDNQDVIKEAIDNHNSNNSVKLVPSFSTVKYLKQHSLEVRDEILEVLEYFLPIYLPYKDVINQVRDESIKVYNNAFDSFKSFTDVYPIVDPSVIPDESDVACYVTTMADGKISLFIRGEVSFLLIGAAIKQVLTDEYKEKQKLIFFKCLSDSTKLRILDSIKEEKLCSMDLVEKLNLTKSTISHHIGQLLTANLILFAGKEGKKMYYSVNVEHMEMMFNDMINDYKES